MERPQIDRATRRMVLALEKKARTTGNWAPWEKVAMAAETMAWASSGSWLRDCHTAYRNGWCAVQVRDCRSRIGIVQHAFITTASETDITWAEKQRIKDEIFGADATAIEVFPSAAKLVDQAPMYHLWVLPAERPLPFGIGKGDPCSDAGYRP